MGQYVIKVLIESKSIVFRDLLIDSNATLETLHTLIKEAFNFKGNELASFTLEDEDLGAEIEIPLENLGEDKVSEMREVKIKEVLKAPQNQLVYTYDYAAEWKFFLELVEIKKLDDSVTFPKVIKKYGTPPKEEERNITGEDAESILMNAILGEELADDEFNEESDHFSQHDSLDDYPDYI